MLKRLMVGIVVVGILGAAVQADVIPIPVQSTFWNTSQALTADGTGWGLNGVTLSWVISKDVSDPLKPLYSYTYSFSPDHVSKWMLETSPDISKVSFSFSTGYNLPTGPQVAGPPWTDNPDPDWALTFTPKTSPYYSYSFTSSQNPVWGDVYAWDAANKTAYNPGFDSDPSDTTSNATLLANWVPIPDSGWGSGDIVVPEPTTGILALTALLAGAFARRRRKKQGEGE